MEPPIGTSIVDVANPKAPRILGQLEVPSNTHSHKARVTDHLLLVNYERCRTTPEVMRPGFKILDVSSPSNPKEIAFVETGGIGVHRFDLDLRYAYISTELEGYVGAITVVYDLADPTKVKEVGRWWQPGQWIAGASDPPGKGTITERTIHCDGKTASTLAAGWAVSRSSTRRTWRD
jgi:hypothetical protein